MRDLRKVGHRSAKLMEGWDGSKSDAALLRPSGRQTADGIVLPDQRPGFDLEEALSRLGGNRRLHAELLLQFVAEHCDCTTAIAHSLSRRRPAEAAATLHRLKGAANIVGARDVSDAAAELEDSVLHGSAKSVDRLHDAIREATALVFANVSAPHSSDLAAKAAAAASSAPPASADPAPAHNGRSGGLDPATAPTGQHAAAALEPLILIVDDEPVNLRVLIDALGDDYRLRTASDGMQALELATTTDPPNLILLDVKMPRMDGYEVCRRLKGEAATQDIPVVFVTTMDDEKDETHGLDLGAIDYIAKPVNPRILRARVRAHLNVKDTQDRFAALSRVDELTGIANRRRLDEALDLEWRRNLRARTPLALVMCDIDHFKQFNDTHGHVAGDQCLRRVAQAIAGAMRRPTDLAARYGGEEFVALLTDTDLDGARRVAEAISLDVARSSLHGAAEDARVTVSCGIACMVPDEVSGPSSLVERADARLYEAKAAGRNRIMG
jgi:diguanylate cyclase (GGDEF)-like protein